METNSSNSQNSVIQPPSVKKDHTNGKTIIITKETTRRLLKDVREMIKQPLDAHGIYYKHDESNILKMSVVEFSIQACLLRDDCISYRNTTWLSR